MIQFSSMVVIKSEFFLALNQVATERGISPEDVLESIKIAIIAAYKKDYKTDELDEDLEVKINQETGESRILHKGKDITPPGFGRIAAQTARQVIVQKIREAEKKTIIKLYTDKVGSIVKGRIIRYDRGFASVDIGKAEGSLPPEEQIKKETYGVNSSFTFYIKEIREDQYGNSKIILSRVHPSLLEKLFEREVPEISSGIVKIKKAVRDPGERAKISVYSEQSGVDPVGACVGQKGVRVRAVTDELGGEEKIDIIQWNSDDVFYIREALSPAKVDEVRIDESKKKAEVIVSEDQAPLAIGVRGSNVNLASQLTDYALDIIQSKGTSKDETEEKENENKEETDTTVN